MRNDASQVRWRIILRRIDKAGEEETQEAIGDLVVSRADRFRLFRVGEELSGLGSDRSAVLWGNGLGVGGWRLIALWGSRTMSRQTGRESALLVLFGLEMQRLGGRTEATAASRGRRGWVASGVINR